MNIYPVSQISQERHAPVRRAIPDRKIGTSVTLLAISAFSFYQLYKFSRSDACVDLHPSLATSAMCSMVKITMGLISLSSFVFSAMIWREGDSKREEAALVAPRGAILQS